MDDWRIDNQPSNPKLLKELTDYFIKKNYDMRALLRKILLSKEFNDEIAPRVFTSLNDFQPRLSSMPYRR